jgi:CRP-like cAMP-binding protein
MVSGNPVFAGDDLFVRRTIRNLRLFKSWPEGPLEDICAGSRVIRATAGENLVRQDQVLNGLYVVAAGCVEIGSTRLDGRRYIRRFAEPGYVFGFPSMFDGKGTTFSYAAHETTQIVFVQKSKFLEILALHPELWLSVVREIVGNHRMTLVTIEESMFESLSIRLARLLVSLADAFGTREDLGTAIHIKLTQDSLADLLGATRQSVSRELKRLESGGLVIIQYGRVTLTDPAALARVATRIADVQLPPSA